jgi:hypothetical protein
LHEEFVGPKSDKLLGDPDAAGIGGERIERPRAESADGIAALFKTSLRQHELDQV